MYDRFFEEDTNVVYNYTVNTNKLKHAKILNNNTVELTINGTTIVLKPFNVWEIIQKVGTNIRKVEEAIIKEMGMPQNIIHRVHSESASFIIAFSDKKTLVEICTAPQMIEVWTEKKHPFFL